MPFSILCGIPRPSPATFQDIFCQPQKKKMFICMARSGVPRDKGKIYGIWVETGGGESLGPWKDRTEKLVCVHV